jgi:SAM-dependent methyltransferase
MEEYMMRKNEQSNLLQSRTLFEPNDFTRLDESDDRVFYETDRFVNHLDSLAQSTVKALIGELIIEENPVILDLMAGWDSHVPEKIKPSKIVGLGLNRNELHKNHDLTEIVIHDINADPRLPFPNDNFNVVINTVSIDYMTRPLEVFREVGRILRPGGLFLVIFSNRMFAQKAVKIWREADEDERIILVDEFFKESGLFDNPTLFMSRGKPRPRSDKYAPLGIPSDPVYALYADKKGGGVLKNLRPNLTVTYGKAIDNDQLKKKEKAVGKTLCCPHCGDKLLKWAVPDNPFCQTWDNEYMYICFNDQCPYYVRGWELMYKETNKTMSYRFMYNPDKDCCMPIPVPSARALKEGIIE